MFSKPKSGSSNKTEKNIKRNTLKTATTTQADKNNEWTEQTNKQQQQQQQQKTRVPCFLEKISVRKILNPNKPKPIKLAHGSLTIAKSAGTN